jgi:glycosyltransferase involved in cell wall biosynthesis
VRSVSQIVDSAPADLDLVLVTSDRDLGERKPYSGLSGRWVSRGSTPVFYLNTHSLVQWLRLIAKLRRGRITLMYVNSLWDPYFSLLPILLCALHILPVKDVLVAPRGELSAGALSLKARKKRWLLLLWRPLLNRLNPIWHASTELEAAEIGAFFQSGRAAVCISSDQTAAPVARADSTRAHKAPPKFVYIGRISRKKNLQAVIDALAVVPMRVSLDIYGPIEDSKYWTMCLQKIAALPSHIDVTYRGELIPSQVVPTFGMYDAFVFPTLGENFGHVIAESLSASCPVICSDQTPWNPVLEFGGGEVVSDPTPARLGAVLAKWAAMTSDEIAVSRDAARAAFLEWFERQNRDNVLDLVLRRFCSSQ